MKLTGFVNSAPDFTDQPKVVNGCSDVFVAVFGDAGPSRPLGRRRGRAAARRRGRGGRCLRDRLSCRRPSSPRPSPTAACTTARRGVDREQPRRLRRRHRRRLRHRDGHPALGRRRGDGLPRRRDAAADRPAGAGARLYRRAARARRRSSAAARPCRRSPRCWRWWPGARRSSSRSRTRTARSAPTSGRSRRGSPSSSPRYDGPVALMSFNPHSVAALAEAAPGRPRGLTTCAFDGADWSLPDYRRAELAALADAERTGAAFVSHDRRDLANPALARLKAEGLPILTWTVRSPAEEAAARRVADNITFEGYRPALIRDSARRCSHATRASLRMLMRAGRPAWTAADAHRDHGPRRPRRDRRRPTGTPAPAMAARARAGRSLHHPPLPRGARGLGLGRPRQRLDAAPPRRPRRAACRSR